ALIAAGVAVVVAAAAVGVAALVTHDHHDTNSASGSLPKLPLSKGGVAKDADVAQSTMLPVAPMDYSLARPLPDLGTTARVWRVESPTDARAAATRLAHALDVDGAVQEVDGSAQVNDGTQHLSVSDGAGLTVTFFTGAGSTAPGFSGSGSSGSAG